jgi:hypothetical protein
MQIANTVLELFGTDGTTDVTPTAVLSYSDIQSHLKLDGSADQTLVESLVSAATKRIEQFIDRKIMNQHWSIYFDCFPREYNKNDWWDGARDGAVTELYSNGSPLVLPFGPCATLSWVRGYDQTDGTLAVDSSNYSVDLIGPRARVALKTGGQWPSATLRPVNGVHIRGVFGMSGTTSTIPHDIKHAIKITVANLYENRGDNTAPPTVPAGAQTFLEPYRIWKLK